MLNRAKVLWKTQSQRRREHADVDFTWTEQNTDLLKEKSQFGDCAAINRKIDLQRATTRLSRALKQLAEDLGNSSITELSEQRGRSRSRLYQMIKEIRSSFKHSGLASY